MKNIIRLASVAALAAAMTLAPASLQAQSRRSGGSSSGSHSSSYNGGSSHSSSRRSSGSVSRSSGSSSRSSGSVSRSSGSVSRQGSAASRQSSGRSVTPSHPSAQSSGRRSAATPSRSTAPGSAAPQSRAGASTSTRRSADGRIATAPQSRGSSAAPAQNRRSAATPGRPVSGTLGNRPAPAATSRRSSASVAAPGGRGPAGAHGMVAPGDHRPNGVPRVHPRDRGFIEHDRIGCFYGHHHPHYYGWRVHALPPHYHHHIYWGWDYYYHSGIYYRWYDGFYCVCRPPFGVYFDRMLYDLDLVLIDFAYFNTVNRTYRAINDNYRTIEEQNRIIAENNAVIARQNASVASRSAMADASYNLAASLGLVQSYADVNVKYYYDDGVFFIEGKDGQYQTIIPPAGAIITELPDDYETIILGGQEYYRVDNTIYRAVAIDGKAYFEVLGQQVN